MFFENIVWWVWAVLGLQTLGLLLVLWLLLRRPRATEDEMVHRQALSSAMAQQAQRIERVEGELRREIGENARGGRQEIQQTLGGFQASLTRQSAEATRTQNAQLDALFPAVDAAARHPGRHADPAAAGHQPGHGASGGRGHAHAECPDRCVCPATGAAAHHPERHPGAPAAGHERRQCAPPGRGADHAGRPARPAAAEQCGQARRNAGHGR